MKKILPTLLLTILTGFCFSQESATATQKGNFLFDVGVSPFIDGIAFKGNTTGFSLASTDGSTIFSLGADGGYFMSDETALKIGLGFTDLDGQQFFSYRFGIKHYAGGNVPLQIDVTGATNENSIGFSGPIETPDPLWLGIQGGYAAFITDNISFEPTLRYNVTLNNDFTEENIFELKFSFVLFF